MRYESNASIRRFHDRFPSIHLPTIRFPGRTLIGKSRALNAPRYERAESQSSAFAIVSGYSSCSFAAKTGTVTMGIQQHYPRAQPMNEDGNYASLPAELSSFTSSTFEPRQERIPEVPKKSSTEQQQQQQQQQRQHQQQQQQQQQHSRRPRPSEDLHEFAGNRRKIGSTDVFGQNMENLVQLEDSVNNRKFQAKSLDEIREEPSRRHTRSVLGLENLIAGLENNLPEQHYARNALRRNQSFDQARYSCIFQPAPSLLAVPLSRRHDTPVCRARLESETQSFLINYSKCAFRALVRHTCATRSRSHIVISSSRFSRRTNLTLRT
jgi:hypothetical protein